jgi:amino acid adenylation domain-containing protein
MIGATPYLLSHLLEETATTSPGALAVRSGDESLSFADLHDRAARLAAALRSVGVNPGDRVAIHLHKSVASWVAVHGVLRSGAAYVPIDPLAPADVLAELVKDAGASILISDASARPLTGVASAGVRVIIGAANAPEGVRSISWAEVATHEPAPIRTVLGDDLAYIMYTSGSTGRPKGIAHTHRSGLRYAQLSRDLYGLCPDDHMANIAPLHFDQSTFELFSGMLAGASVLAVPEPVLRFPASLSELAAREMVTVWYSVPFVLTQLLQRGALGDRDLSSLRWVLYGGENFPSPLLRELMALWPHATFSNVYGPAEVNQCTYHHLAGPPTDAQAVPIGRAWADTDVILADLESRPVRPGQVGEILVRSATEMRGYWKSTDLTTARYRDLQHADGARTRWFATGDLAFENPNGDLVFVGRSDNQVKIRGHRVELEAVDAALATLNGVTAAVTLCERRIDGADVLVACVATSEALDERAILSALRRRLPAYAVPQRVVQVATLPMTSSGKVDRNAAQRECLRNASPEVPIDPSHHLDIPRSNVIDIATHRTNSSRPTTAS